MDQQKGMSRTITPALSALALALAACGGVSTNSDAAPGQDSTMADARSGTDAPTPDAGPRIVTVTVYTEEGGILSVGTPVVFHNPDGSVLSAKQTDAAGQATEIIPAGAAVTALVRAWDVKSPYPSLMSALGLMGGEDLVFGNWRQPNDYTTLGSLTVTVPAAPTAGASMSVSAGCTSAYLGSSTSASMQVYASCPDPFDLFSTSYASGSYELTHYAIRKAIPFVDGGTVAMPAWRSDFATTTFELGGVPVGVDGVQVNSSALIGLQQHQLFYGYTELTGVTSTSVASRTINGADKRVHNLRIQGPNGSSSVSWTRAMAPAVDTVNLGADFLPFVSDATVTGGVVTFTKSGATALADITLAQVGWNDAGTYGNWTLLVPPDQSSVTLPTLPIEFALNAPGPAASYYSNVGQLEHDAWSGYPAALAAFSSRGDLDAIVSGATDGVLKSSLNQNDR